MIQQFNQFFKYIYYQKLKLKKQVMNSNQEQHKENIAKVAIIGSGPAGYTAAIYCARAELHPVLFEGDMSTGITPGGQLTTTTDVDNFPAFPDGVGGYELVERMKQQAIKYGTQIESETVIDVNLNKVDGYRQLKTNLGNNWKFDGLIIATGANAKRLESLGNLDKFWNNGISACAVCDGALPLFRNKVLVVAGGGDSAMEEAIFLTKYASRVYIVHRRDVLRASKIMQTKATNNKKIEFIFNTNIIEASGDDKLESIELVDNTGNITQLECGGLFFGIGHTPSSQLFSDSLLLNKSGYIITKPDSTQVYDKTMEVIDGVFACGDVQDHIWRQAITAAGTGCMAALEVEKYLN